MLHQIIVHVTGGEVGKKSNTINARSIIVYYIVLKMTSRFGEKRWQQQVLCMRRGVNNQPS